VEADPGQLRQVLLNVAVNARDAMPDGGRITFETRSGHLDDQFVESIPGLQSGDYVAVVVSDTGTGMNSTVVERALEPFYTTKPVGSGTGLGLAVASDVVKSHGGHVAISSATGVGTAVRIYLPSAGCPVSPPAVTQPPQTTESERTEESPPEAASGAEDAPKDEVTSEPRGAATQPIQSYVPMAVEQEAPAACEETAATSVEEKPGQGIRILVVDDEKVVRDMTAEMLRSEGYDVVTAMDGVEALDVYRRHWGKFSAVLLDIVMPRLGGLETFRRLRGMDREAKIILCSGYTDNEKAHQAVAEGAVGLLHKPFGMNEILGWIKKALES
jgi:two-component system cell cycle sensor histidine kinase/response regulator CckA